MIEEGSQSKVKKKNRLITSGRHSGLIFTVLGCRLSGLGPSLGGGTVLCPWPRHVTLTVPFPALLHRNGYQIS